MHRDPIPDSDGRFAAPETTKIKCPRCGFLAVTVREWESTDGAYDDDRYDCGHCGHYWWVEGPDA